MKMTKAEIEKELIEARQMLSDAQRGEISEDAKRRNQLAQIDKYEYWRRTGSYPADNFEAMDTNTGLAVRQSYVNQLENQLKSL